MFAGDVATPTQSTWNDTSRTPGVDLSFNGVPHKLKKDENFRKLYALITARSHENAAYQVTATLTGTFFAAPRNGRYPAGYGHMHCCHLLLISEVANVDSIPPAIQTITGTVVSSTGAPIEGVQVVNETEACCQVQRDQSATDEKGRFAFNNPGRILYFQLPNLRPRAVTLDGAKADIRVALEDSRETDWMLADCEHPDTRSSDKLIGFTYNFLVPADSNVSQRSLKDSTMYLIRRPGADVVSTLRVLSGSRFAGFTDTSHWLANSNYWSQRWIKDPTGRVIGIDTVGRTEANHLFWRIAMFRNQEGAAFWTSSKEASEYFDTIVDSACSSQQ